MARKKKEWTPLTEGLLEDLTKAMRRGLNIENLCGLYDINPSDFSRWIAKGLRDEKDKPAKWKTLEARLVKAARRTRAQMYDEWMQTVIEGQGQRSKNAMKLLEIYFPKTWKVPEEEMRIWLFRQDDDDTPIKENVTEFDLLAEAMSHVES